MVTYSACFSINPRWDQLPTSEGLMGCLTSCEGMQCFVGWVVVFSPAANPSKCLRSSISGCWIMIELCSQIYTKYTCYHLLLVDAGLTYAFFSIPGMRILRDFNQAAGWLRLGGHMDSGIFTRKNGATSKDVKHVIRIWLMMEYSNIIH